MEAYFSNIQNVIMNELDRAQCSIKIAVAWLTNAALLDCITQKSKDGVHVDIVMNNDEINNNKSSKKYLYNLLRNCCRLHWIQYPELMHQKFCIIDSKTLINGSYNWTFKAEKLNRENIIVLNDAVVVRAFEREFANLCSLYPSCSDVPPTGPSNIPYDELKKIKRMEENSNSNYEADIEVVAPVTEWNGTDKLCVQMIIPSTAHALLMDAITGVCEEMETKDEGGYGIVSYDALLQRHSLTSPRKYFRLFIESTSGKYDICIKDGDIVRSSGHLTISNDSPSYILLYSNFTVDSLTNYHNKYKYAKFRILVRINVNANIPITQLNLRLVNLMGVRENLIHQQDTVTYISPPDGKIYYFVISPVKDCDISFDIRYLGKHDKWTFHVNEGQTHYLGYVCNQSEKYATEKIYIKKGIKS